MPTIEERVTELETKVAMMMMQNAVAKAPAHTGGVEPAPDSEIDSQYGNPVVRKDPPRWVGISCVGMPYSKCPPDFLDSLAGFLEWCAGREETTPGKEKYAAYSRKDAARALGWARRLRANPAKQPSLPQQQEVPLDDYGF